MNAESRMTEKKCPCCGTNLRKPVPADDWHEWDCFNCGLEVPHVTMIDGGSLIDFAATQPDPAAFLRAVLDLR